KPEPGLAGQTAPPPSEPPVSSIPVEEIPDVAPSDGPEREEAEPARSSAIPAVPLQTDAAPPPSGPERWAGMERSLSTRWLVWLGGFALALGGIFFVKYAIDFGYLGPRVRVTLGILLGIAMTAAGEWLRRRSGAEAAGPLGPDYVPPALCAAGLATVYGAVFAGYELYGIIPTWLAFALLSITSAAAIGLSLLHGPYVAALGLLGGFVTPALVSTDTPSAWGLVIFLMFLSAGGFTVSRLRQWQWLEWMTLAGAAAWAMFWMAAFWRPGDVGAIATYLLVLGGIVAYHAWLVPADASDDTSSPWQMDELAPAHRFMLVAAAVLAVCLFVLVRVDDYGGWSLAAVMLFAAGALFVAQRRPALDSLVPITPLLPLVVLATWRLQSATVDEIFLNGLSDDAVAFASFATIVAVAFAATGFAVLKWVLRPGYWAGLSVGTPLLVLAIAYSRSDAFRQDELWSLLALALAVCSFAAASWSSRHRAQPGMDAALGAYAIGVIGSVSIFATMLLEDAWLTVALAAQIPAMAWVNERLRLPGIRPVAALVATVVLARLVINPYVLDYPMGTIPGVSWILYGYGAPALAFYWAAKRFRIESDDRLVALLEAGAILFSVMLMTFEIRHLFGGDQLARAPYDLSEQSVQSAAWLLYGYAMFRRQKSHPRVVQAYAWRIMAGLAAAHVVFIQLLLSNPLFTGEPVGATPVFNLLLLAYGLPAVMAGLFAREALQQDMPRLAMGAGIGCLVLVFATLNLEVRQAFRGSVILLGAISDAEWYAYSLAWLVLATALLFVGIYRSVPILRHASLVLVLLTVGKVFLFDMAGLEGLYRATSFLGLGLTLLGVGFFYRRFVYRPADPEDEPSPTPQSDAVS
ncbi:MAG: DUF2339 domain-containing protein, partial [Alphaproteobacteria bacterium]|nr:DUF2339 domain-containing protein [Alphaproteobacteria bacterium]